VLRTISASSPNTTSSTNSRTTSASTGSPSIPTPSSHHRYGAARVSCGPRLGATHRRDRRPRPQRGLAGTLHRGSKREAYSCLTAAWHHAGWPRAVAGGGRGFGACCFAGKLRSSAPPAERPSLPGPAGGRRPLRHSLRQPYVNPTSTLRQPYVNPTSTPTRPGCVPLASVAEGVCTGQCPFGGPVGVKPRPTGPPRGSGAAAPGGALRAID
jgi:hypothetical protein